MASEQRRAIEAILMVADQPIEPGMLAQLLEVSPAKVEEICAELTAEYDGEDRGFVLQRVAGGYRFQSHPDLAPYVERFVLEGQTARMSAAALETLAIVAYKQPVSRAQVSAIRGVNVDGVMRTLQQRGYIEEVARDPGPGQAVLYGTTRAFLEKLGIDSIDQLPPLGEFVPGPEVVEALEHGLRPEPLGVVVDGVEEAGPLTMTPVSADDLVDTEAADQEASDDEATEATDEASVARDDATVAPDDATDEPADQPPDGIG